MSTASREGKRSAATSATSAASTADPGASSAPAKARDAVAGASSWPALSLAQWQPTYETLHMCMQIVGKTRLALAPLQNHWWQVTLYPTVRGLATGAMPCGERSVEVEFDFVDHRLVIRSSDGISKALALVSRPVAQFFVEYMETLRALDVHVRLHPVPVEVVTAIPFERDVEHAAYDPDAAQRHWRLLLQVQRVFEMFRTRFVGKASPVHFFWGSFDLATTRFSGRKAPRHPGGVPNCPDYVMVEAYAQECASWGFWPGGGAMREAAFYAYAYPEPVGYAERRVEPDAAHYHPELHEFVLPYDAVRHAANPDETLLAFLQSTYEASADLAGWDRTALDRPCAQWRGLT